MRAEPSPIGPYREYCPSSHCASSYGTELKKKKGRNYFVNDKIAGSCPTNILSEHCIKRYKEQKRTLKNNYANCSLQKQTISVRFNLQATVNTRIVRTYDFEVQVDQDLTLTYRELSEKSA